MEKEKVKGSKIINQNKGVVKKINLDKEAVSSSPLYISFYSDRIHGSGPETDPTGIITRTYKVLSEGQKRRRQ